jgi:hypothetical protein
VSEQLGRHAGRRRLRSTGLFLAVRRFVVDLVGELGNEVVE